jgi:hypothetical protein
MYHPEFSVVGKFGMICLLNKLGIMTFWKIHLPFEPVPTFIVVGRKKRGGLNFFLLRPALARHLLRAIESCIFLYEFILYFPFVPNLGLAERDFVHA